MKACAAPSRCCWSWLFLRGRQALGTAGARWLQAEAAWAGGSTSSTGFGQSTSLSVLSRQTSSRHTNRMASHLTLDKGLYCPEKQSVCLSRHNERALAYGRAPVKEHKNKDDFSQLHVCHSLCAAMFLKLDVVI